MPPVPDSPVAGRTFASSHFKAAYSQVSVPQGPMDLGGGGGAEIWLTLDVPAASTDATTSADANDGTDGNDAGSDDGSDDETAAEAEPDSAMTEPDAVSDASDSDSEASNDEDG
jgi:hypothetical protein